LSHSFRVTTDEQDGIEEDEIEFDVLMTKALPEVLPIKGHRIKFYYPGIKSLCLKCFKSGHPKWECPQPFKTNWLEYVLKFFKASEVSHDMLGSWVDTLIEYHPELQEEKPLWSKQNKDLRDGLIDKERTHRRGGRQLNPLTQHPNFQKNRKPYLQPIGQVQNYHNDQQEYYQPDYYNRQYNQRQDHFQPRGRGQGPNRGRGGRQGRGRGRGQYWIDPSMNQAFANRRGHFYTDLQ